MKISTIKDKWVEVMGQGTWRYYEAIISTVCTLFLKDNENPIGLIIIGASSGSKTTILNMFRKLPKAMTHVSDKFTPASFLTQACNIKKEELENIDLIRKLPNRVLLVPDLAPMFGKKEVELKDNLSTLTRVMDGDGLSNDGGGQGHREFNEECIFVMLGAIVQINKNQLKMISEMGTRLLFIRMDKIENSDFSDEFSKMIKESKGFQKGKKDLNEMTSELIEYLMTLNNGLRNVEIQDLSDDVTHTISIIGQLTSKLRAEYNKDLETLEQREMPMRVMNQLKNIAKGRAVVHQRNEVNLDDMRLLLDICLSSVSQCRGEIVRVMLDYNEKMVTKDLVELTNFKDTLVRNELNNLAELMVLTKVIENGVDYWLLNKKLLPLSKL